MKCIYMQTTRLDLVVKVWSNMHQILSLNLRLLYTQKNYLYTRITLIFHILINLNKIFYNVFDWKMSQT